MDAFIKEFVKRTRQILEQHTHHDRVDHTRFHLCTHQPAFDVYYHAQDESIIICAVIRCDCDTEIYTQKTQKAAKERLIEYMKILGKYDMVVEYHSEREATEENVCPLPILAIPEKWIRRVR